MARYIGGKGAFMLISMFFIRQEFLQSIVNYLIIGMDFYQFTIVIMP